MPLAPAFRVLSGMRLHLALIAFLGLFAYSDTLSVPFQWDEKFFILKNPFIKNPECLFSEEFSATELYNAVRSRIVGYLSFAINYRLHGFDVRGYHIVNLAIHIINAFLVYFLITLILRSPFFKEHPPPEGLPIALCVALIFVVHPIQTLAVTYVFQRLASLAAMFFLLSIVLYIKGRTLSDARSIVLYVLALISSVLAFKTKENTAVISLVLLLYESLFQKASIRKRLFLVAPFFLLISLIILFEDRVYDIRGYTAISRKHYIFTQFRVIITYLRLIFLPIGQNIDYDYPLYRSFLIPEVFFSFISIVSIMVGSFGFLRYPIGRLFIFGVWWFLITLLPESGLVPLPRLINEYRLYIPSIGAFLAVLVIFYRIKMPSLTKKIFILAVVLALSIATFQRNKVWGSELSLWLDAVEKSPRKGSCHINLALAYKEMGLLEKAKEHLQIALALDPVNCIDALTDIGVIYEEMGRTDEAIECYLSALRYLPYDADLHYNLGTAYAQKGALDLAILEYKKALEINPCEPDFHFSIACAYRKKGLKEEAITHHKRAIALDPEYRKARLELGLLYLSKGLRELAIKEFEELLRKDPSDYQARAMLEHIYKCGRPR